MSAPKPDRFETRIGIWGATGSGKTTYLGALRQAAEQTKRSDVAWSVIGADDVSTAVLTDYSGTLTNERLFPAATFTRVPLRMNLLGSRRPPRPGQQSATKGSQVEFGVEMLDMSGQMVDDRTWRDPSILAPAEEEEDDLDFDISDPSDERGPEADLEDVLRHLTDCQGFLLLFDPVQDEKAGDAFRYFNTMMAQIQARTLRAGRMLGAKLPHHVAVCITKFDDREVLCKALSPEELTGLKDVRPPLRIESSTAARYLNLLAQERPNGGARLVRDAIEAYVLPERLKYYATSSVGYWWGPNERFDPHDFTNVLDNGGASTIRSRIRPMNVLEPMVWLASHIRKAQRDGLQT